MTADGLRVCLPECGFKSEIRQERGSAQSRTLEICIANCTVYVKKKSAFLLMHTKTFALLRMRNYSKDLFKVVLLVLFICISFIVF